MNRFRAKLQPAVALLLGALLVVAARSQAQLFVTWSTIDGGGVSSSAGGTLQLSGTAAQPDAASAPVLSGGAFQLSGGFWTVTQACFCLGDLNHDGRRDGLDVQQFVACLSAGGDCSCADLDGTGGLTLADAAQFIDALLTDSSCP